MHKLPDKKPKAVGDKPLIGGLFFLEVSEGRVFSGQ